MSEDGSQKCVVLNKQNPTSVKGTLEFLASLLG